MGRVAKAAATAIVLILIWSVAFHLSGLLHVLGIRPTPQGTSAWYQLWSGFIPALTVVSLATLIGGMWHHVNCHADGCWRIGRHHLNGQVWCNRHAGKARPAQTTEELLAAILDRLNQLMTHP